MKNKLFTPKSIAQDGIFCALCILILININFTTSNWKIYCFSLVVLFTIFYTNKNILKGLISSLVIFCCSFLFSNPLNVLLFVLPNCLVGIISSKLITTKLKYLLPIVFLLLITYEYVIYSYVFLGKDLIMFFVDTIKVINISSKLLIISENKHLFALLFIACALIIDAVESVVLFLLYRLINKRINKLLN